MVLTAGVMGDMDASQVQVSPHLSSLPTESQLFIKECLSAVLLQRVNLPCRLHTIHHLQSSSPSNLVVSGSGCASLEGRCLTVFVPHQIS